MPEPLTPADCDLRDFPRMMLDIPRLRASSFDATIDDSAWRAALNLWMSSWHGDPAASLENDEGALCKAAALGRDTKTWNKVKVVAMRGWVLCDDGRLYHETVAEFALEAWLEKLAKRLSSGAGNEKRWGAAFDPSSIEADIANAARLLCALNPSSKALPKASRRLSRPVPAGKEKSSQRDAEAVPPGSQETGTGTGNDRKETLEASASSAPDVIADPDAQAWSLAVVVLTRQGDLTEKQSRAFFGGLLKRHGLKASEMLVALIHAEDAGTLDPQSYLTQSAKNLRRNNVQPLTSTERRTSREENLQRGFEAGLAVARRGA